MVSSSGSQPLPLLPMVAAAPAGEDEDAIAVAQFEEMIVLHLAFEADGVEVHVADVAELGILALGGGAQQHVEGVAGAADQDVLAVDMEDAVKFGIHLAGDLANAEFGVAGIGDGAADVECKVEGVEILFAHLGGPPEAGVGDFLGEVNDARFMRGQADGLRECGGFDLALEHAFDRLTGGISQFGADGEAGAVRRR